MDGDKRARMYICTPQVAHSFVSPPAPFLPPRYVPLGPHKVPGGRMVQHIHVH